MSTHRFRRSRTALRLLAAFFVAAGLGAADPSAVAALEKLTVERLADPALSASVPTGLAWHRDGKRLTYLRPSGEERDLYAFDIREEEEALLVRGSALDLPGGKGRLHPLNSATWMPDDRHLLVPADGDIYLVDVETGTVRPLVKTEATEDFPTPSPDGKRVAFVRDNDLYVVDLKSGRETRLTSTGSETLLNGRLDWVYEEELGNRTGKAFAWAPNSRAIAYLQLDQSGVPTFPIVDFLPVWNEVEWQRYPKAGSPNSVVKLGVVGIEKNGSVGPERVVSVGAADDYIAPQIGWTPKSRNVVFQQMGRAQNELRLRLLPVPGQPREPLGEPRTVITERSDTFVNLLLPPRF